MQRNHSHWDTRDAAVVYIYALTEATEVLHPHALDSSTLAEKTAGGRHLLHIYCLFLWVKGKMPQFSLLLAHRNTFQREQCCFKKTDRFVLYWLEHTCTNYIHVLLLRPLLNFRSHCGPTNQEVLPQLDQNFYTNTGKIRKICFSFSGSEIFS